MFRFQNTDSRHLERLVHRRIAILLQYRCALMQVVGSLCVAPNTIRDPECMVWVMATKAETKQDTNETPMLC